MVGWLSTPLQTCADLHKATATLTSTHPWHSEIRSSDLRNLAQLRTAPSHATQTVNPPMTHLATRASHQQPDRVDSSQDYFDSSRAHTSPPPILPSSPPS